MARRDASGDVGPRGRRAGAGAERLTSPAVPTGRSPKSWLRWERAVHDPGIYDLEVDTSTASPEACATAILRRLAEGPPVAFAALAARS